MMKNMRKLMENWADWPRPKKKPYTPPSPTEEDIARSKAIEKWTNFFQAGGFGFEARAIDFSDVAPELIELLG